MFIKIKWCHQCYLKITKTVFTVSTEHVTVTVKSVYCNTDMGDFCKLSNKQQGATWQ